MDTQAPRRPDARKIIDTMVEAMTRGIEDFDEEFSLVPGKYEVYLYPEALGEIEALRPYFVERSSTQLDKALPRLNRRDPARRAHTFVGCLKRIFKRSWFRKAAEITEDNLHPRRYQRAGNDPRRDIERIVLENAGRPEQTVQVLIDAANAAGGTDNVTVIVVEGVDFAAAGVRRSHKTRETRNATPEVEVPNIPRPATQSAQPAPVATPSHTASISRKPRYIPLDFGALSSSPCWAWAHGISCIIETAAQILLRQRVRSSILCVSDPMNRLRSTSASRRPIPVT